VTLLSVRLRRWLGGGALALLLLLSITIAWNWTHLRTFPGVLPAFYAKEFCSCRYVMGQSLDYCHSYARQYLPISTFALDEAAKRVTVRATFVTRSARWLGPRDGCRLE
jgi:hypothetical protein